MPLRTVHGIVLRYADYRDSDRILTIFTQEMGIVSANARGCRRAKSPLLGLSELFVYAQYVLSENKNRMTVYSGEVLETFYPIREDLDKFWAASAMLSFTERAAEAGQHERLFRLLYYALCYIAYSDVSPQDVMLGYMIKALSMLGFQPALTHCARCGQDLRNKRGLRFSPALGGATCGSCSEDMRISTLSLEALRRILLLEDEELNKVQLPEKVRGELRPALKAYCECVLDCRLKSL